MRVAPGCPFEGSNQIKTPDHEQPHDRDHLERLGWQAGLTSIVLTFFIGAHGLLGVSHRGWPVEALSEHVPDQAPRCSMMSTYPVVDISQQ